MELSRIPKNKNFVSKAHWITIRPPKDLSKVKELCKQLDLGESESIALALELKTDLILMDEYLGRELATMHKLKVIGIIGVLIRAKQEDLIASLKTEIQKLKAVGFRINIKLETMIIDKFDV